MSEDEDIKYQDGGEADEVFPIVTEEEAKQAYEAAKRKLNNITISHIQESKQLVNQALTKVLDIICKLNDGISKEEAANRRFETLKIFDSDLAQYMKEVGDNLDSYEPEEIKRHLSFFLSEQSQIIKRYTRQTKKTKYRNYLARIIDNKAAKLFEEYNRLYNPSYKLILSGKGTTALQHLSGRSFERNKLISDIATAEYKGTTITKVDYDFDKYKLRGDIGLLSDIIRLKVTSDFPHYDKTILPTEFTDSQTQAIEKHLYQEISVREFMKIRNLKDYKTASEQLNSGLKELSHTVISWEEERRTKDGKKVKLPPFTLPLIAAVDEGESYIKNGVAYFTLTMPYAKFLAQASLNYYATKLLEVDLKYHPHAYYIGNALVDMANMKKSQTKKKGTREPYRIKVSTLIAEDPNLPDYETVKDYKNRIKNPFENDLDYLRDKLGVIDSWKYTLQHGVVLTEAEKSVGSYNDWTNWYIEFTLKDFPDINNQ